MAEEKEEKKAAAEDAAAQKLVDKNQDMVAKANEAAERLEKANEAMGQNIAKQEKLKIEATLGGETEAGSKEETEEQKEIAGAKEMLKGTGFEDVLDPPKKE